VSRTFRAHHRDPNVDERALTFFQEMGYAVVEGMLDPSELRAVRQVVADLAAEELRKGTAHLYATNMQRVWTLLAKHPIFQGLMTSPQLLGWMERLFDRATPHQKYFLSSLQANLLKPGAPRLKLHVDTPVPEPLPPWIIKANSVWLLDEFTENNGSTEVIPGSHLRTRKPRPEQIEDAEGIIKVIAPAGSVVYMHGALWHRSGANNSHAERIVLLGSFAASYAREIASEEDTVRCLPPEVLNQMGDEVKKLIGYYHGMKPGGDLYQ
jgi:ectoine hydroxylase-related dioxygenase (phytanoyl-CoA dioxygenase family)